MISPITYFAFLLISLSKSAVLAKITKIPDVTQYFSEIDNDFTKVTWAHAVNSERALNKTLNDDTIMMIEADVRMGLIKGLTKKVPVMKHNEETQANITLERFLQLITKADKKKGLKLDFKETDAFMNSLTILSEKKPLFPLWINADIIKGPGGTQPNVTLIKEHMTKLPLGVVFSLGWTTGKAMYKVPYDKEAMDNMLQELTSLGIGAYNITFPVRAVSAAESNITYVLENNDSRTLTIWSAPDDTEFVNVKKLNKLISENRHRIFVDVPNSLKRKLNSLKPAENDSNKTDGALLA